MQLFKHKITMVALAILLLTQCASRSDTLAEYLNRNYKNKLDVIALIGKDRPVIDFIIKNDKALLTVTAPSGENHDSTFFIIIDIPNNKIINTLKSPYEPYYNVRADINGDSVFCFSDYNSHKNKIISIKTKQEREFNIKDSCISIPAQIIAFDKFILHTGSLYGSSAANLTTGRTTVFKNEFVSNQMAISIPFSSINLISGRKQAFGNDSISLIALDQTAGEVWNYKIKLLGDGIAGNIGNMEILRTSETFIIRNSSQLLALDAQSGKVRWNKIFPPYTTHAFLWKKNIFLYTEHMKGSFKMHEDNFKDLKVILIEPETGNEVWRNEFETTEHVNIASTENDLFIISKSSFKVLNGKGKLKFDTTREENNTGIEWAMDKITGKNYLLYDRKALYW